MLIFEKCTFAQSQKSGGKLYFLYKISIFIKYRYFTMNISFTKKQEEYISKQVASGEYQNNSEVIRDALRLHGIYREKVIQDLRKEIELGWDGPDSSMTMDQIIEVKRTSKTK